MAHEPTAAATWLRNTLWGDQTLRDLGVTGVFHRRAPQNTQTPYIVFALQSGGVDNNAAASRVLSTPLYQVKVISRSDDIEAATAPLAIVARLDALLGEARGEQDDVRIVVESASPLDYAEDGPGGVLYTHQGRLWRLYLASN